MNTKSSLLLIGSLTSNRSFLQEAFGFFDEVYVSNEIPNQEEAALFLAKKPNILVISCDRFVTTKCFTYIEGMRASDPKIMIAIIFLEDVSELHMRNFLKYNYDFYRAIDTKNLLDIQLKECAKTLKELFIQRKEAYMMKRYYQYLIDNSIVTQTDAEGNIVFVNDLFCKTTGFTRQEVMLKNHRFMRHPENDDTLYASMWETISNGGVWRERILNKNKDGSDFWADTLIIPFVDEISGKILEYTAIRRDVTQILSMQQESQKKALLAEKNIELATAKETFLSLFTHELKTPLNALINFSRYLYTAKQNREIVEESREIHLLSEINKSANVMLNNVTTILDLQKLRSNKLTYTPTLFDVKKTIETVVKQHMSLVQEYNRKIEFSKMTHGYIHSDEYRFSQIISNILSNAIKYGHERIIITLSITDEKMYLCIEDDGKGIRDKQNVFQMFEQDKHSTTLAHQQGTGLGLYFLKLLCEDLGFHYAIEDSLLLGGTCFILTKTLRNSDEKNTHR